MQPQNITALIETIAAISSDLTLDEFTQRITRFIGAAGCLIFRFQPENESLVVLADYMSPPIQTAFDVGSIGMVYPLTHYPALVQVRQAQTLCIISIDDPTTIETEKELLHARQCREAVIIPMVCQTRTIGALSLFLNNQDGFTQEQERFCRVLANQAAVAIETVYLSQAAQEGQLVAEALQVIGRALASDLDYARVARNVADFAYRLVNAAAIDMVVPENDSFHLLAQAGHAQLGTFFNPDLNMTSESWLDTPLFQAINEKRPVVITDLPDATSAAAWQQALRQRGWRAITATPLLAHNHLVGVLVAYAGQPSFFTGDDVATLMSLASQAAVAIQNAQLFAELEMQREALHQVSLRLVNAQEDERRRISRELHDELGQALTALKINLDVARRSLPADAPAKLRQSVSEASTLAVQTLEAARNLSLELHPAILDDLGLVSALRWEVDRYEQRTGQSIYFKAELDNVELRPELEITIYRIVTEALTNVARHAQAQHISVQLQVDNQLVVVVVEDDGLGFDAPAWFNAPTQRQSLGLISMRERAGLLGGQFEIISSPGYGTKILARLPLHR